MKKNLFFLALSILLSALTIKAQTVTDDFEAYVAGQMLACQNPAFWTTWSNAPCGAEDCFVSTNFAFSGTKSALIVQNDDVVRLHENLSTGTWYLDFMVYIPVGKSGYFNNLSDFSFGTGGYWAMECYFDIGGAGRLLTSGTTTFTYPNGTWFPVSLMVNLTSDQAQLRVNNVLAHTWQWTMGASGGVGPLVLDALDLFGATANDEMYVDNYRFSDTPIPVELTSFIAIGNNGVVELNWTTATEINNQMFEIQRHSGENEFSTIGFVEGQGTTSEPQEYSYTDRNVLAGKYSYRLKQIDYDGNFEYSDVVEVDVLPTGFSLQQNYPNPFNPSTSIRFSLPESDFVRLSVYNLVGEEVALLVNGMLEAGTHNVTFEANNLPSGTYIYKLQAGNSTEVKKMILMK